MVDYSEKHIGKSLGTAKVKAS